MFVIQGSYFNQGVITNTAYLGIGKVHLTVDLRTNIEYEKGFDNEWMIFSLPNAQNAMHVLHFLEAHPIVLTNTSTCI
jgi:hypothetical protein